ncbi:MAG: hypothetical protein HY699_00715 [Deltaproteobacteria bacterium]|nr:hypothetical protein [Deltaproteobacteria bacterium]
MNDAELKQLGRRARERLEAALAVNDLDEARRACAELPKEYVLIHKGLRQVLEYAMEYIEQIFRAEQAAVAARITAAVEAGDFDRARALLHERDRQHQVIHDRFIDTKAGFYSYVAEVFGDQRLEGILRHTGERQRAGFERWEQQWRGESAAAFTRASVHLLKTHMGRVSVSEDEEKFTITQDPCGSGGRLMREGAYDRPDGLSRVDRPQAMTFDKPDFPSYCAHCAVWNNIQCIEWFGHPQWAIDHPATPDDPCRIHIYKDPGRVPERYYRQVGKQRPDKPQT